VPDTITVASVQQYKANVELLLQQTEARFRNLVTIGSYVGKAASIVEQFGEATAQEKTGRHSDTPNLGVSQDKRWVHPRDYEWATLLDSQDQLRSIVELSSPLAKAGAAGMARKQDDIILTAMFGTSYKGENGTTAETWDTAYDVGVNVGGTASGINVAKLQNGIRLLITANKGELMEPVNGAIGAFEHDSLLKEVQIANRDYGGSAVLVDGKVKRFMGVDFLLTERLSIVSGNRQVPLWMKSGSHLGIWQDMTADISQRKDKGLAWQVYLCMTMGGARTQLGKTVKVLCDDQI
jgi:hypothetical protein